MAMDYKHRVPGNRNRGPRKPKRKGPWAASALAVVAILAAWMVFHGDDDSTPQPEETKTTQLPVPPIHPPTKPATKEAKQPDPEKKPEEPTLPPKPPEPRFSFYKILPEKEVIIPDSEIRTIKREESLGNKPAGTQYLLQAGSFPNLQDAEKVKSQLSQLKIKSRIESVKIENTVWHRVKIGPFSNLVDADKVRTYLRGNQIDSVIQKAAGN